MSQTILVPLDGSPSAEQAFNYAAVIAQPVSTRLLFFRAVDPASGTFYPRPVDGSAREEAHRYLESFVHRARARGVLAECLVGEDAPGPAIVAAARERNVDLIVMSTQGKGGLSRMICGSAAQHVFEHSPAPVLMVPRDAESNWVPERVF